MAAFELSPSGIEFIAGPNLTDLRQPIVSHAEQQPVAELGNKRSAFVGFGFCSVSKSVQQSVAEFL